MSQSSSFNSSQLMGGYDSSFAMDSPVAYQRNFSKFSKLAGKFNLI